MPTITALKDRIKSWRRRSVSQTPIVPISDKARINHLRLHREQGDIKEDLCIDPSRDDIRLLAGGLQHHGNNEENPPKNLDIKAKDGNVELSVDLLSSFEAPPIVMDVQSEKGCVSMKLDASNAIMNAAFTLNIQAKQDVNLKIPNFRAGLLTVSTGEVAVKGNLIGDWREGQRLDVYNIQVQEGDISIQYTRERL